MECSLGVADFWTRLDQCIGVATGQPFTSRRRQSLSGGCINQAWRVGDGERDYFVKINVAAGLPMFEAEAAGLAELALFFQPPDEVLSER